MEQSSNTKKSNVWLWIFIAIIVLIVLFYVFRAPKETKERTSVGEKITPPNIEPDDITVFDIDDNPDIGVDDFNSLEVSEEGIIP